MWRHRGWINPYIEHSIPPNKFPARAVAYEAGADAMLENLRSNGRFHEDFVEKDGTERHGWVVFIPDEE